MNKSVNTLPEEKKQDAPNAGAPIQDVPVKGAFNRYDSPFLQLIAPLIATRYLWLAIEDINPLNFLNKPDPRLKPDFKPWEAPKTLGGFLSRNFVAYGIGITFLSIIGLYSKNTLHDIKSLYAEAVGFELGKKKEDVTLGDVFFRSDNEAVKVTRSAYLFRTFLRVATAATFFVPWHVFRKFKEEAPKFEANANAGVGAIGLYLLGEGFLRDPSFFDIEQKMVANSIHHIDDKLHQTIVPNNILTLLMLQRKHLNNKYKLPDTGTTEGQKELQLAEYITERMNKTYHNTPNPDEANFTIGKFNYLIGFGLLNSFPASLGFVELANKSSDMKDVNNAAAAIKNGLDPKEVFTQFGIDINTLQRSDKTVLPQPEPAVEPSSKKFADGVKPAEIRDIKPKTHADFATQTSGTTLGV